jgi:hypothetical protein
LIANPIILGNAYFVNSGKRFMKRTSFDMNKHEIEHEARRVRTEMGLKSDAMDSCELTKHIITHLCEFMEYEKRRLETALLWVIHEQCEYSGKVYAKLLIHGEEAFKALGLEDGCSIEEIEKRLFGED